MFVAVDVRERAAPVGTFLVQRHELVPGGMRNQNLELARGVHHFHSTARLAEFRDTGHVYDEQVWRDAHGVRSDFRQRAAVLRSSCQADAGRAG